MIKKIFPLLFILLFASDISNAQFTPYNHYAGPSLGLSFLGSTAQFGGNYEYSLVIENFGTVGVGGIIRYWSYSETFPGGKWSYTNFLIGAQGNYHFKIPNNNVIDPWAGIVLAYDAGSVDYVGPAGSQFVTPSHGGLWLGFNGGVRYWLTPQLALSGRIGFGTLSYGAIDVGVDFKF